MTAYWGRIDTCRRLKLYSKAVYIMVSFYSLIYLPCSPCNRTSANRSPLRFGVWRCRVFVTYQTPYDLVACHISANYGLHGKRSIERPAFAIKCNSRLLRSMVFHYNETVSHGPLVSDAQFFCAQSVFMKSAGSMSQRMGFSGFSPPPKMKSSPYFSLIAARKS